MGHHNFLLKFLQPNLLEGPFHPLRNNRKILPPFELFLGLGSIGEIDKEHLIIFEGVLVVKGLPHLMVVGPALQKDNYIFAVLVAFQKILERLCFCHRYFQK